MFPYSAAVPEILLPVLAMLAVERLFVLRGMRTPKQIAWVRGCWFLHPNTISRLRYPMGFLSVAILHLGWPKLAFLFFTFWMITDLTDGEIARHCNLSTPKGETIDPLSDKLMYGPPLAYFAWQGWYPIWLVALFLFFDFLGQASRSFLPNKAANLFGKAKTFLVVLLLTITTLEWIYGPHALHRAILPLLGFCTALSLCSMAFRVIPNYWYANILSLMNMVCGLAGIWVILAGYPPVYAFGLVFLGQFLDLFDGRAAERWGSTPRGEIFDDVADGTSFGLTVGLIVATSFASLSTGIALGLLYLAATWYRLVRFVLEKRKAGVLGGVKTFAGMPSPGGALLVGSGCLILGGDLLKAIVVLGAAGLMVSRIPYSHFGRAALPRIPRIARVLVLALFLVLLAQGVRRDEYGAPLAISFALALIYVASPVLLRVAGRGEDRQ